MGPWKVEGNASGRRVWESDATALLTHLTHLTHYHHHHHHHHPACFHYIPISPLSSLFSLSLFSLLSPLNLYFKHLERIEANLPNTLPSPLLSCPLVSISISVYNVSNQSINQINRGESLKYSLLSSPLLQITLPSNPHHPYHSFLCSKGNLHLLLL